MSICPFAVQQIIPESHTQGRINPTTLIFHEAVSSADSLQGYWNSPGNELESHFYIGRDGTLYQFVDTQVRADANMSANNFAISVETWDNGGDVNAPWNAAQLETAKRLAAWCRDEHGIPGRAPTMWSSGGIGGHNWFPTEWAGGPRACPGPNRSAQIRNDIIPHVATGGGSTAPTAEVPDMTPDEHKMLEELQFGTANVRSIGRVGQVIADTGTAVQAIQAQLAGLVNVLGALSTNKDVTPDTIRQMLDDAVAKASPALAGQVAAKVTEGLRPELLAILGQDNSAQADEILAKMADRLRLVASNGKAVA